MVLTISANLPPEHVMHLLKNPPEKPLVINHLIDSGRIPFAIRNNTMLVLSEGYHRRPNVGFYLLKFIR